MSRYLAVISSFFIMLCLGGVYAWSIFVPMLKIQLGYSSSQTQLIVGLTLGVFATFMIFSGKLEKKYGPKTIAFVGGICLFSGYFLAYLSQGNFILLCLGIGGFCGIGTACCYVCCLVVPAKNFPSHKGFSTGIAVGGFGAGAILLSFVVKTLLANNTGITVLALFKYIALAYGGIVLIFSLLLQYPKNETVANNSTKFNIYDSNFIVLFFTMFAGTFAGLLILTNAKPIVISYGYDENIATLSISLLAIGNMSGRVIWGLFLDKIGVDKTLYIAYLIMISATFLLNFMPMSENVLYVILVLIGLGFSSNMIVFAGKTVQLYGVDKLGIIYPYIFLGYGIAGVIGPLVGGFLFDIFKNYHLALSISGVMSLIGLIVYASFVNRINKNVI